MAAVALSFSDIESEMLLYVMVRRVRRRMGFQDGFYTCCWCRNTACPSRVTRRKLV